MPKKEYLSEKDRIDLAIQYLEDAREAMKVAYDTLAGIGRGPELIDMTHGGGMVLQQINKARLDLTVPIKTLRDRIKAGQS